MSNGNGKGMARRLVKRWTLPKGCSIREFSMRELDVNDDIDVHVWVEKNTPSASLEPTMGAFSAQTREAMRLALVTVDGEKVNVAGVPYLQMNQWSLKTLRFVQMAFTELNGATEDEMADFKAAGELVVEEATPAEGVSQGHPALATHAHGAA